ncbi:MAG: cobalamin-dependent protein [Pseudomonadota bacterium]
MSERREGDPSESGAMPSRPSTRSTAALDAEIGDISSDSDISAASINTLIASELAPRLLLAHRVRDAVAASEEFSVFQQILPTDREYFEQLILEDISGSAVDFVRSLVDRGVSANDVMLDLMGGTAVRLGEMWETDETDMARVTIGLCNLHEVLRERQWQIPKAIPFERDGRRILLATLGEDQHIFGLCTVAEVFRREGWRTLAAPGAGVEAIAKSLSEQHFDILGLSASNDFSLDDAKAEIDSYRSASKNRDLKVLVGGRAFNQNSGLVGALGAEGWSRDARDAPSAAGALLDADPIGR